MARRRRLVVVAAGLLYVFLSVGSSPRLAADSEPQAPQPPTVEELVKRAGEYHQQYSTKLSGVTLDELFLLTDTSAGMNRVPQRLASDLVIIKVDDRILGLRDLYAVDTKPLRDHQPRIITALANPTMANWELVQKYARENASYLFNNVVVWYSDPTLALQFVADVNQDKLTYKLEGSKKMDGVQVYGVGFKEHPDGSSLFAPIPGNPHASGRLWVEPNGAIHATDLWVVSDTDNVRMQVTFAPEPKLGLLLPKSAAHTFEWREGGGRTGNAVIGALEKLKYEANATYKNARYTAIDLGRAK